MEGPREPLFSRDNTCVMRTYLCGLTIWSGGEPAGGLLVGGVQRKGEPGVSFPGSSANDLEEQVNCTFMKFLAEEQKGKH